MKKLLLLFLIVVLLAGGAVVLLYLRVNQTYRGYGSVEQFVELPTGAGSTAIGQRLVAAGVVRDVATFRTAIWLSGQGRHLKAGEYRFNRAMTPFEVVDKIARGDVYVITITFPEGLTAAEMAAIFESHGIGSASSFEDA